MFQPPKGCSQWRGGRKHAVAGPACKGGERRQIHLGKGGTGERLAWVCIGKTAFLAERLNGLGWETTKQDIEKERKKIPGGGNRSRFPIQKGVSSRKKPFLGSPVEEGGKKPSLPFKTKTEKETRLPLSLGGKLVVKSRKSWLAFSSRTGKKRGGPMGGKEKS